MLFGIASNNLCKYKVNGVAVINGIFSLHFFRYQIAGLNSIHSAISSFFAGFTAEISLIELIAKKK